MFGNGNQNNPADSFYLDDDRGTAITLTSTANPSPYGQPLNFTATVAPINPALGTPPGTVQFQTNGVNFGDPVILSGGKATSTTLPPTLLLGVYNVSALYSGDTDFTAGTGVLANGQSIYLQTTFSYNGTAQGPALGGIWPGGTNTALYLGISYQGDSYVGTSAPTNAGNYSITNPIAVDGLGDCPTNIQSFTILRATNVVQLTSSSYSSTYGDNVIFTAHIQTNGVTAEDATGSIMLFVDGAIVMTNLLTNGVTIFSTSSLTATGHSLTVTYSGDNNYTNNATGVINHNVTPASPVFRNLTGSQSITYGTPQVDLSGSLSAGADIYPPQGELLVISIAGLLTNTTVLDGSGNFSISIPTPSIPANSSPYLISYAYAGDGNFYAASDSNSSLTVNPAPASVRLQHLNQTYSGNSEGVTVATTPVNLAASITYDGGSNPPTNAGSYTVVANITDSNYQGSATNMLVIARAPQTISFAALPLFVLGDAPYTLAASASSGLPVSYSSSDSSVASVTGNVISFLAAGSTIVTATQIGNSNYLTTFTNQTLMVTNYVAILNISQNINVSYTNITLSITGNPGRTYTLEYKDDIFQTNWQTLQIFTNLLDGTYQVNDPATNPARFYRLQHPAWTPN